MSVPLHNRPMTVGEQAIAVVPANEVAWEDLQKVFGTRGPASRCQCQRYRLHRREFFGSFPAEERAARLREQADCGHPGSGTTSGLLVEVSAPTPRRVVMRVDF